MRELIEAVEMESRSQGLSSRMIISEKLWRDIHGTLIFSHHTYRDEQFRRLEANGNQVWHFKAGDLPGTMVIDRCGFSGWSSLADKSADEIPSSVSQSEVDRFVASSHMAVEAANLSKYQQPKRRGPVSGKRYVFIALQTKNDIVQRLAFVPMLDMLEMVVDRFANSPVEVLIKRHPKCDDDEVSAAISMQLSKAANIRLVDASIHDILSNAEAVFTVNSGVGSEALAYEIPVYCFGRSDYAAAVHQVRSKAELGDLTSPIHRKLPDADHRRFYHYYRTIYQISSPNIRTRVSEILYAFKRAGVNAICLLSPIAIWAV